jgi:hypothetical protein
VDFIFANFEIPQKAFFNILLELKTKNVFLHQIKIMTHALNIVWNPSEGIDLGFFIIRFYSLMFVIAFGLGWYIMKTSLNVRSIY